MQQSVQNPTRVNYMLKEPAAVSRLRTVTENRFPRRCACDCGFQIPRVPEVWYVVNLGAARPYPAYLREPSSD